MAALGEGGSESEGGVGDDAEAESNQSNQTVATDTGEVDAVEIANSDAESKFDQTANIRRDPLALLAEAAGYSDSERWWEHMIEERQDSSELFEAIAEAMTALRAEVDATSPRDTLDREREQLREAHMRKNLRKAIKDGYENIAVVCGAWHTPALANMPTKKHDAEILKGMKRIKIDSTFTPWTHSRLTMRSGYGAGIWSPGWYQHRWQSETDDLPISWLTKVAQLLRGEDLDASPAQVIDAVRLADTLAAIRERSMPSLEEFNEAALSVFCFGNPAPLNIIHDKLIVGETMGEIPDCSAWHRRSPKIESNSWCR